MNTQPRIAILGSCVTRQAFRHNQGREAWRLERPVHYQARTSLVSLTSPPLAAPEPLLASIADPFEQRSTRDDFERSFWQRLAASQPDLLLIDLVDERFDLLRAPAQDAPRFATLSDLVERWHSTELRRSGRRLLRRLRGRLGLQRPTGLARFGLTPLRRLTSEVEQLWLASAASFVERLRATHPRLRVVLHLAPLPTGFEDGSDRPLDPAAWWLRKPQHLEALRALFARYAARLRELMPDAALLEAPPETHLLGRRHVWSEAPWHYGDLYYRALTDRLRRLF